MARQTALQTRVDANLARLAKEAAAREGEDVSNWLRRLVTRELRPSGMIAAWTDPRKDRRNDGLIPDHKPEFYLAPLRGSAIGDRDFVIYTAPDKRLTAQEHDNARPFWLQIEQRWVILRGSPTPWLPMGHMQDIEGRIVLTLRRLA
jgi:hypothetical protein